MNIISCSRRTDVPRWHSGWLERCLLARRAEFTAPRGGRRSVPLDPGSVFAIVLWSKDYSPLLENPRLLELLLALNPYFHFTVTGLGGTFWEPGVPRWRDSLSQAERLAATVGPERITWRFDPIVHWRQDGHVESNLDLFPEMAAAFAGIGIETCIFSFACWYRKAQRRTLKAGVEVVEPGGEEKLLMCRSMLAGSAGIGLAACAQPELSAVDGIGRARCIDARLLEGLRADGRSLQPAADPSQRRDCRCHQSIDIGSYSQRCGGAPCLYCYAN